MSPKPALFNFQDKNILTAEKIFVSVSLFNMLRIPLTLFPMVTKEMIQLFVSTKRIRKFLNAEELQVYNFTQLLS